MVKVRSTESVTKKTSLRGLYLLNRSTSRDMLYCPKGGGSMTEFEKLVLEKLDSIGEKLDRMESKMDAVYEQVAKNTEHEVAFNELAATVAHHDIDIKVLKKAIAN